MRIKDCKIDVVMLPTRRPHKWTGIGKNKIGHYPIIRLGSDDGIVGFGEAPVLPTWGGDYGRYFGEDIFTTIHVVKDVLFPVIKDENPMHLRKLLADMDSVIVGFPYAKAAIDMAMHDMIGKELGKPVYEYLGGRHKGLLVCHSIGLMDPEASAREARLAVREGIRAIKIKIGMGKKHDVATVQAVRSAVGSKILLSVDANRGYTNNEEAIEAIKLMEKHDLTFVEQPVEGIRNLAKISKSVDVPIIADESAWSIQDALDILEMKAARGISVYTTKPGGLHRAKNILDLCGRERLMCNINGSCETGVGNAANIHLGASSDAINMPCVVPVTNIEGKEQTKVAGVFYRDDIILEPFKYENGYIYPNRKPGFGIALDEEKLERYRSRYFPEAVSGSRP
jgi:muconate cycloisomerase